MNKGKNRRKRKEKDTDVVVVGYRQARAKRKKETWVQSKKKKEASLGLVVWPLCPRPLHKKKGDSTVPTTGGRPGPLSAVADGEEPPNAPVGDGLGKVTGSGDAPIAPVTDPLH